MDFYSILYRFFDKHPRKNLFGNAQHFDLKFPYV